MGRDASSDNERATRVQLGELEEFERILRGAHDDVWWRRFIELIRERRASFIDSLVAGDMDQRSEDRTRGQISELNFVLSLDQYAENDNARRNSTTN